MRKRVVMLLLGVSLAMSIAGCGGEKEKTYTQSEVDTNELMLKGIRDISELQIGFHIEDENNDEYISMDPVTIKSKNNYDYSEEAFYPSLLNPSVANELGYSVVMSSDEVLYDANGIKVNAAAVVSNSDGDESLMLEVENTSSEPLVASTGDIAINGVVVSSGTWDSSRINAGKKDVAIVQLDRVLESENKEILEISEIGEISLNLQVKDKYFDDIADPANITITIPNRDNTSGAAGTEIYNANDLKISSLGKMDDPSEYSGDIHFLFLVENTGSENRVIDVDYDGNSINGFMVDLSGYAMEMKPGQKALLDAYIFEHNKGDCDIESADDVTDLELAFTIKDKDWSKIAEDSATVTY